MRFNCFLMAGLAVVVFSAPVSAQTRRAPAENSRVELPHPGRVSMIGVRLTDVTADNMKALKLSKNEGAVVASVNPNSPAAVAGLRQNDVIVQFDGERVRSASHLARLVGETPAQREVQVGVMRDGARTDLRIQPEASTSWFDPRFGGTVDLDSEDLREQLEKAGRAARELGRRLPDVMGDAGEGVPAQSRGRLGVNVQEVSDDLAAYFGVKAGALVVAVTPDSPAAKAGLKVGDVITAIDGRPITTPRELVAALPSGNTRSDVALTVVREKKELIVTATLEPASPERRPASGHRV
jgi:serine protease Do